MNPFRRNPPPPIAPTNVDQLIAERNELRELYVEAAQRVAKVEAQRDAARRLQREAEHAFQQSEQRHHECAVRCQDLTRQLAEREAQLAKSGHALAPAPHGCDRGHVVEPGEADEVFNGQRFRAN